MYLKRLGMFINPLAELSDEAHGSEPHGLVDGGGEGENLVQHRRHNVVLLRDYVPEQVQRYTPTAYRSLAIYIGMTRLIC